MASLSYLQKEYSLLIDKFYPSWCDDMKDKERDKLRTRYINAGIFDYQLAVSNIINDIDTSMVLMVNDIAKENIRLALFSFSKALLKLKNSLKPFAREFSHIDEYNKTVNFSIESFNCMVLALVTELESER